MSAFTTKLVKFQKADFKLNEKLGRKNYQPQKEALAFLQRHYQYNDCKDSEGKRQLVSLSNHLGAQLTHLHP